MAPAFRERPRLVEGQPRRLKDLGFSEVADLPKP